MPKFKVLTPIEHNETHYWPEPAVGAPAPPKEAPSFGHGRSIPVNPSGVIELSEAEAKPLLTGNAIAPTKAPREKKEKE
jgi:hypothetical protein